MRAIRAVCGKSRVRDTLPRARPRKQTTAPTLLAKPVTQIPAHTR